MRIHSYHRLYKQRLLCSTRSFKARGSKVNRCQFCQVEQNLCLCPYQPEVDANIAIILLLSSNEVFKPSNTGRLILDTIKEGYAYQWSRTDPDKQMLELMNNPQYQPIVVFPKENVESKCRILDLNNAWLNHGKKPLLIFLDGSWREARRMFRKSPYLDSLPVLSISPQSLSQYVMRRSDNSQHLATAEVASIVFSQLGEKLAAQTLSLWFDVFKETYLMSKSQSKSDIQRPKLQHYLNRENPS
ncbi:tRNA-uridine aminocarboxypropyltransferase [Vibrio hepatarius]|uniref:tRNA-uridine aminocarboxypropyltransferase n=1 Tax=Vibrio hepatarius TaxID=171383 RepID=UPI001C08F9E3|nr:tRNA-uridine aminocarboxypropyltransferase [Vibrio hepatarius]MBU2898974.1 DTW domain-containing protein [Vibrio hepatarius]